MISISEQLKQSVLDVCAVLDTAQTSAISGGSGGSLPAVVDRLDEVGLQRLLSAAATLRSETDAVIAAGAGVVAKRSERDLGYSGLAARKGYRSATAVIQAITGSSRSEAARQVRLGEAMAEVDAAARAFEAGKCAGDGEGFGTGDGVGSAPDPKDGRLKDPLLAGSCGPSSPALPWFEPVTRAVAEHALTSDGAAAIIRGMGEPCDHCDAETMRGGVTQLLQYAAQLAAERPSAGSKMSASSALNADELGKLARQMRDQIDPVGVTERFEKHYEDRVWRFGRNSSGARTAWIQFDDESGAWIDSIVSAGMRPRRGGPRFVDAAERARAEELVNDPRTNDQLVFDLIMDTLRAGAIADPTTAFGTRQPGLRVIVAQDELNKHDLDGNLTGIGFLEDTGEAVPPAMLERMLCDVGTRQITVDSSGNPLDVGREQRLFTAKQKVAMAYRDGGCMDPFCDQPPSYAEAHHTDEWHADHGRTDIADGVLLCRFSHMRVHNQGWKIRREGSAYWMIPPTNIDPNQTPIRMRSKAAWRRTSAGRTGAEQASAGRTGAG